MIAAIVLEVGMRIGCAGATAYYLDPRRVGANGGRAALGPGLIVGYVVVENELGVVWIYEVNDAQ